MASFKEKETPDHHLPGLTSPLLKIADFLFESYLGKIKKLVRTPVNPLAQVSMHLAELELNTDVIMKPNIQSDFNREKKNCEFVQYRNFTIKMVKPDNVVLLNTDEIFVYSDMIRLYCQNGCVATDAAQAYEELYPNAPQKLAPKTFQRTWARLVETGSVLPNKRECGARRSVLTVRKEEQVLDLFNQDGTRSIREVARETDISPRLLLLKDAPNYTSYARSYFESYVKATSYLGEIKSLLRSSIKLLAQYCRRMYEKDSFCKKKACLPPNKKRFWKNHVEFPMRLFPTHPFDEHPVQFPTVQQQSNSNDFGVFAIAFTISLLFNIDPHKVRYDHCVMRLHLIKMFETNVIEYFPQDLKYGISQKMPSLSPIKAYEAQLNRNIPSSGKNFTSKMINFRNEQIDLINPHKNNEHEPMHFEEYIQSEQHDDKSVLDPHMDYFNLFKSCSDYEPAGMWQIYFLDKIQPVPKDKKHIQILHSSDGHWFCSFYDGINLFIYDSLKRKILHEDHKKFLRQLFPTYLVDEHFVQFLDVQQQPNFNDCGVFAIAFVISLLFNIDPHK
ncbi:hypothetical protein PV326_006471, partial [Microctonus aethiopoides]